MGLIKAAILGGVAYWAVQKASNKENGRGCCAKRQAKRQAAAMKDQSNMTKTLGQDEAYPTGQDYHQEKNQQGLFVDPPKYPQESYPFYPEGNGQHGQAQLMPPYYNEQSMTVIEPKQRYRATTATNYPTSPAVPAATAGVTEAEKTFNTNVIALPDSNVSRADMVINQTMSHLRAGREDDARDLLNRAMKV